MPPGIGAPGPLPWYYATDGRHAQTVGRATSASGIPIAASTGQPDRRHGAVMLPPASGASCHLHTTSHAQCSMPSLRDQAAQIWDALPNANALGSFQGRDRPSDVAHTAPAVAMPSARATWTPPMVLRFDEALRILGLMKATPEAVIKLMDSVLLPGRPCQGEEPAPPR